MIKPILSSLLLALVAAQLLWFGPLGSLFAYVVVAGTAAALSLRLPGRHSKAIGLAALAFLIAHGLRYFAGQAPYDAILIVGYLIIAYATYAVFRSSSRRFELSLILEAGAIVSSLATVLAFNPYFAVPSTKIYVVVLATGAILFMLMSDLGRQTVPIVKMYLLGVIVATWMEAFSHLVPEAAFSAVWTAPYYPLIVGLLLPADKRQLSQSYQSVRRQFGLPQIMLYGAAMGTFAIVGSLNNAMPLAWTALALLTAVLIFARISLLVRQRDWSFGQEQELRRFGESLISLGSADDIDVVTKRTLRHLAGEQASVAIVEVRPTDSNHGGDAAFEQESGHYVTVTQAEPMIARPPSRLVWSRREPVQFGDVDARLQSWFSANARSHLMVPVPANDGGGESVRYFVCQSPDLLRPETEDHFQAAAAQYSLASRSQQLAASLKDQTAQLAMEEAWREAQEAWQALTVGSHEVALRVQGDVVVATTPQPELILGVNPLNRSKSELEFLQEGLTSGESFQNPQRPGQWLKVSVQASADDSELYTVREVTAEVADAATDSVTGFPFSSTLDPVAGFPESVIVLFDIAGLDHVKERHGRAAANEAFGAIAERLAASFRRDEDRFWRGDGNQLLVATSQSLTDVAILERAKAIASASENEAYELKPKVTVAVVDLDASLNAGAVLQRLQIALNQGFSNDLEVVRFSDELYTRVRRHWTLEEALRNSLDDPGQCGFLVHYQPLVSARPGAALVGAEALARWVHPDFGMISPGEFIPMAESLGLIDVLDNFVLCQVLRDIDSFRQIDPDLVIHVNMSPVGSLATKLDAVRNTVVVHGGDKARSLVVEITESALGSQAHDELLRATRKLRDIGVALAVDDFGTGESNFDRVAELPFTEVKLSRNFVEADHVVLASLIHNFHSMGLSVVAENVETEQQLRRMQEAECDIIQGYFYSRPNERETTLAWMRERAAASVR